MNWPKSTMKWLTLLNADVDGALEILDEQILHSAFLMAAETCSSLGIRLSSPQIADDAADLLCAIANVVPRPKQAPGDSWRYGA